MTVKMQMTEIRKLKNEQVWDFVKNRGLITSETDTRRVKRHLIQWVQFNCKHYHNYKLYDMEGCLCPNCDEILEYDFDIDHNVCINQCGFKATPEESGSLSVPADFDWMEACIGCWDCEFQGHPKELDNPFAEVTECDVTW